MNFYYQPVGTPATKIGETVICLCCGHRTADSAVFAIVTCSNCGKDTPASK